MSLRSRATITIAVVRLSNVADMKNVMIPMIHSSLRLRRVVIRFVMILKPPCTSISSTMVMAPIRKNRISAISPRLSMICTCCT